MKTELKVKDHGFNAVMKRLKDLAQIRSAAVKVGVLADDSKGGLHEKGANGKAAPLTVAEIFAVLNFGTRDGKIPPRPVLAQTFDAKREHLKEMGAELMAKVIFGEVGLDDALNMMGASLASSVKAAITAGFPPPNAPSVALRKAMKGNTKRLFEAKIGNNKVSKRGKVSLSGLGDAFSAIGATAAAEKGGYGLGLRIRRQGLRAAKGLGDAFAQVGALAAVKTFIDTGRLLGAITWTIVRGHED